MMDLLFWADWLGVIVAVSICLSFAIGTAMGYYVGRREEWRRLYELYRQLCAYREQQEMADSSQDVSVKLYGFTQGRGSVRGVGGPFSVS